MNNKVEQPKSKYSPTPNELSDSWIHHIETIREWKVIMVIMLETFGKFRKAVPLSLNDIAELAQLDKGNASKAVTSLVEKGYISRTKENHNQPYMYCVMVNIGVAQEQPLSGGRVAQEQPLEGEVTHSGVAQEQPSRIPDNIYNIESNNIDNANNIKLYNSITTSHPLWIDMRQVVRDINKGKNYKMQGKVTKDLIATHHRPSEVRMLLVALVNATRIDPTITSNMYALCSTACSLLTAQPPYNERDVLKLVSQWKKEQWPKNGYTLPSILKHIGKVRPIDAPQEEEEIDMERRAYIQEMMNDQN